MDRPIIFSAPMVRALLAGRKTQTRRVIKLPTKTHSGGPIYERPDMGGWEATTHGGAGCFTIGKDGARQSVPELVGIWHQTTGTCVAAAYQPGDRLYVREHWRSTPAYDDLAPAEMGGDEPVLYIADDATLNWAEADGTRRGRHRQAMHMPRWASRVTLIVDDVRCQPLQDISREDAIAEGLALASNAIEEFWRWPEPHHENLWLSPPAAYRHLWNSLHGADAWDANPWVVALTFRVERGNIDNLGSAA
ncbi:hypothetical protein [Sphingomonas sanxanigenens]|uniref:Uncharacterized protein n=1 Tax=Sphingomonas sanxanigenens DSM 19645 = NX02 TaxID=1123269 RepID=W0AHQ2_9SPHN|nr:hypothetical protein [Sphingomonas sanxanigenens]AHE56052.1 hypothetical protein NX02_22135 [Sphingomonas sanxanigenens DSM 19645 = NX02]